MNLSKILAYPSRKYPEHEAIVTLDERLKDKVASYKIPKLYEKLETLPRNMTGKLLKYKLREQNGEVLN